MDRTSGAGGKAQHSVPLKALPGRSVELQGADHLMLHPHHTSRERSLLTASWGTKKYMAQDASTKEDNLRNSPEHRNSTGVSSEPTYYMVKFQYPIKKGMKEEVTRLSKDKMLRYLPHDVFIVSMLPSAADKISKLHGVIGVYYLPSDVKVSPDLHMHLKNQIKRQQPASDAKTRYRLGNEQRQVERSKHIPVDKFQHDAKTRGNTRLNHQVNTRSWKPNHASFESSDVSDKESDEIIELLIRQKESKTAKSTDKTDLLDQLLATVQAEKQAKKSEKITSEFRERFRAVSAAGNYDAWTTGKMDSNKNPKMPQTDHNSRKDFTCDDGDSVTLEVGLAQNLLQFNVVSSELLMTWEKELNMDGAETATIKPVSRRKLVVQTMCGNLDHVTSFFSSRAAVYSIQVRSEMHLLNKHASTVMQGSGSGLRSVFWDKGLTGEGEIVGIADTGIDTDSCFFHDLQSPDIQNCYVPSCTPWSCNPPTSQCWGSDACQPNLSHRKIVQYNHHVPGSTGLGYPLDPVGGHGTHVAGTVAGAAGSAFAGEYNGTAKGAKIVFDDISPDGWSLSGIPHDLNELFFHLHKAGARIHSNSWGSASSSYTIESMEVDQFMYEHDDFLVVFAAGNGGPVLSSVGSPATSKNSLSVGSSSNTRDSYVEHEFTTYYNLSMHIWGNYSGNQGSLEKIVDILPASFGADLSSNAESIYTDGMTIFDVMTATPRELKHFCTEPSLGGCEVSESNQTTATWTVLSSINTLGDSNSALQLDATWHTIYGGPSCDDCYEKIPDFGFDFCIFGENIRDSAFVGSNSYITFGAGFSNWYDFDFMMATTLRMGAGDQSYQRVYGKHFIESNVQGYVVRFEGTNSRQGQIGNPNIIWEVAFLSNQTIITSVPLFSACSLGGSCDFSFYSDLASPVLTFGYQSFSVMITGISQPGIPGIQSAPYQSSETGFLLVLHLDYMQYFRFTCKHDVFSYNAGRANFTGVIFGSAWLGAPATSIIGDSHVISNVTIPVMSISNIDTEFIVSGFSFQSSSQSSAFLGTSNIQSTLPIVNNERSDRTFTHKDLSYFSSRGPTFPDFRNKPDIVAPGQDIWSANSDGMAGSYQCGASAGESDSSILSMSGTSMAAPGVAGAAALVRQYYAEGFHVSGVQNVTAGFQPSSALVKATILQSGSQIRHQWLNRSRTAPTLQWSVPSHSPSYEQGYGLMDLSSALSFADSKFRSFPIDRQLLDHGSHYDVCFMTSAGSVDANLRASLVWTDPPGYPYAAKALVNNLDLSITAVMSPGPVRHYFYGNAPNSGERYLDSINNAEQVTLKAVPASTLIMVRVTGTDVPQTPQAFSLLVSGPVVRSDCPESVPVCENDCSGHGTCVGGVCVCDSTYNGVDCSIVACGNGRISSDEQCDDGNQHDNDGCSSLCLLERGFKCQQSYLDSARCSKCDCGCLYLSENTGVISSNGSSSSSYGGLCESEIDRSGWETEETQIVVESLSSGSYMIFGLPCHDPAYSGVEMEECWIQSFIYQLGSGMQSYYTDIGDYRGMHAFRVPFSKIRVQVYTWISEVHIISYGPAIHGVCGDGIIDLPETCDDRNVASGDGCSWRCWQECDYNNCCMVDLPLNGNMPFDDEWLQRLLPAHEFSTDSSCLELRIPALYEEEMATMLDVFVHEKYYSKICPFWGEERPLTLVGPGGLLAASDTIPNNTSRTWINLTVTGHGRYVVPDLGFDFCLMGQNVRRSIEVHQDSFVTFGLNAPIDHAGGWNSLNPPSPTLFLNTDGTHYCAWNHVSAVFATSIIDNSSQYPRRGYLVRFEGSFVSYGYYGSSLTTPIWEITFFEDNTLHVAIARGNDVVDITHAMLTDGNGNTIVRLGRAINVSNILQTTPGCGVAHTPQQCSMLKVESQNFSSTVSSTSKFRSSQGFVVTHSSKTTANSWHMPIKMVFWQGFPLAQCGNGVLDSPVSFLNSAKCQVTDSSQSVCRQNITLPVVSAHDSTAMMLLDIKVESDLFDAMSQSSITDVYINGNRIGGNYLSGYSNSRVCGQFKQIVEYQVPSDISQDRSPGPRTIAIEIRFQHNWGNYGGGVPCFCSPCTSMVLNAKVNLKRVEAMEECDDANRANTDGCSSHCLVESGANCSGATSHSGPSVCSRGSGGEPCTKCLVEIPYEKLHWGQDQRYLFCSLPMKWGEILKARFTNCSMSFKTGGLGNMLVKESFESWLCLQDHPCASNYPQDPYFCFVYDEQMMRFVPWGENAELQLINLRDNQRVMDVKNEGN